MTNSREKFEALYGPMGFDLTRKECSAPEPWSEYENIYTGYAWAGWKAGRESMRDDVIPVVFGQCESDNVAQRTVDAIKEIEP